VPTDKAVRVANAERLKKRMLALAGPEAQQVIAKANRLNAEDMRATVARIIPHGDPRDGHISESLLTGELPPTASFVSIGNDRTPYPLHLEVGHRDRAGNHVPGKAFWYPAKRVTKKKAHGRLVRAERIAIKAAAASFAGGSDE
jgi:hypothetical protein